ncbi:MAG: metallophosphoesterase [Anaerovoracaceae bacterium]
MLAIILTPIYLLGCFYVIKHGIRWMQACHGVCHSRPFKWIYFFVFWVTAISPYAGFFLPISPIQRLIQIYSHFWLGVFLYALMVIALVDLVKIIAKRFKLLSLQAFQSRLNYALLGGTVTIVLLVVCLYGFIHSKDIQEVEYTAEIHKQVAGKDSLKVVMVGDMHLGYDTGEKRMAEMVELINKQEPDLVCFVGDIFNNDYKAIKDPQLVAEVLSGIESKQGVYACYGNHDVKEPILFGFTFSGKKNRPLRTPEMEAFMEAAKIKPLMDEAVLVDDEFYIVGRLDKDKNGNPKEGRATAETLLSSLDQTKPIIVLDHVPKEFEELAKAGADLDLGGHTHDGQIFPMNLTSKIIWENSTGKMTKDKMTSIVTSGIGTFGPNMRVGTQSEVVTIKLDFQGKTSP